MEQDPKDESFTIKNENLEVNEVICFGSFFKNNGSTPRSDSEIAMIVEQTDKTFIKKIDNFFTDPIRCEYGSLYEKGEREDAGGGKLFYKKDPKGD